MDWNLDIDWDKKNKKEDVEAKQSKAKAGICLFRKGN